MGARAGLSMLYLEARCLAVVRAAGSQGVQNGSISCVALVLAVPGGTRAILGENVIAAWLDLEVASGNDAIASHSAIRKTAKLMGQFLPGTDFVTSGYSVMPRHDNTFGGGNFDADDLDEWLTIQRDWQVDAGIEPVSEDELLACPRARGARGAGGLRRARAARRSRTTRSRRRRPATTAATCRTATAPPTSRRPTRALERGVSGLDVALALDRRGFGDIAEAIVGMQRQRVSADYLQTSAVIDADGLVHSAVNDPNVYLGPGHRLPARGRALGAAPGAAARRSTPRPARATPEADAAPVVEPSGEAAAGRRAGRGRGRRRARPSADSIRETINGLDHGDVLEAVCEGIREGGGEPRLVRVRRIADVAFIAHDGAGFPGPASRSASSRRARR